VAELFDRSPYNPLLCADDWPYPAGAVFNPAVAQVGKETVLVCRVEDRRGISHLTVARSSDGEVGWRVRDRPLVGPHALGSASSWGLEDPRATFVPELTAWALTFTSYGPDGPGVALALTRDFETVEHVGVVVPPEDKDASLLPERIGGKFVLLHRPMSQRSGRFAVWASTSADLRSWDSPRLVLRARIGPWWDTERVGMGPPPLRTPHGWLVFYHGVKQLAGGLLYRVGVVLLDLVEPWRVRHRCDDWVLSPVMPYERSGDAPNVVFPTGLVHDEHQDRLRLYYGAADSCVAMATASYREVLDYVRSSPAGADPAGGEPI
jgi:predicted GH43/DUF377 family glycosyl hydrolase